MYCALVQWETYNQDIALIFAIVRSRKVTKYVSTSWVLNKGSIFYIVNSDFIFYCLPIIDV